MVHATSAPKPTGLMGLVTWPHPKWGGRDSQSYHASGWWVTWKYLVSRTHSSCSNYHVVDVSTNTIANTRAQSKWFGGTAQWSWPENFAVGNNLLCPCCDWHWTLGNSEVAFISVDRHGSRKSEVTTQRPRHVMGDGCDVPSAFLFCVVFSPTLSRLPYRNTYHCFPVNWMFRLRSQTGAISATEEQWWWILYTCKYNLSDL